jgi:hypothetical protein
LKLQIGSCGVPIRKINSEATKRELRPLVAFMRYAHRRVFDRLHTQNPEAFEPFKEEFGTKFSEHRHGKLVGRERYRMRPNEKFIKRDPEMRKDWTNATGVIRSPGRGPTDQPWQRRRGDEDQAGNTAGANREEQLRHASRHHAAPHKKISGAGRTALHHGHSVRLSLNKPVPELPHEGKPPPPPHPAHHIAGRAAKLVEQHFGASTWKHRRSARSKAGAAIPRKSC